LSDVESQLALVGYKLDSTRNYAYMIEVADTISDEQVAMTFLTILLLTLAGGMIGGSAYLMNGLNIKNSKSGY